MDSGFSNCDARMGALLTGRSGHCVSLTVVSTFLFKQEDVIQKEYIPCLITK